MQRGIQTLQERETDRAESGTVSLCDTCIHSAHCSLHARFAGPVLECNEFEGINGAASPKHGKIIAFPESDRQKTGDLSLGLCATCLNRDTCKFAKPDTGVWHCEEYR